METVNDFIFLGDCIHEIKIHLLLGRKVMTNLGSILRSRDRTLPTKVRLVKAMVFPVVMYGCKSWTIKKSECQRIDAFELWCWRWLLRVLCTAKRSKQSILKEVGGQSWVFTGRTHVEAETPILWPPDAKSWLTGKDPDAGKDWGQEKKGTTEDEMVGWHHRVNGHGFGWTPGSQRVGHDWATELNWTVCVQLLSCFRHSATPWTEARQAPFSVEFSRQEYWSRLPFPSPGDLPDPGIKPASPTSPASQADSLLLSHWGSPKFP